jgi:phage shock protein A
LCLQRRQGIAKQQQKLQLMRDEYRSSRQRMKKDIGHCEEELANMMQKHQVMRARQSTAEAMQIIERSNSASLEDIENSFDRWEVNIAQGEYSVDRAEESFDELEQEYLEEENEQQLRYELAELLKENALNEQDANSNRQGGAL